jgi:glucosamine--fructose-6-phosphate aminotransferase (isomerizing)
MFLDEMDISPKAFTEFKSLKIIACGTSWHAALAGKFMIEKLARIPVEVDYGSEFRYRDPIISSDMLTVVISQSGETADTLAAQREAKQHGSKTLAICNVVGSMITREASGTLMTHAGPEIGVASTKAFTSQLTALFHPGDVSGPGARDADARTIGKPGAGAGALAWKLERC